MFTRNVHQPTQHLYLYTSGFSSGLRCTTHYKRPSLEESFIMHSRLGLACSHAPSHSLCELPPLKPPLIMLGTFVQIFSPLRALCSMLRWHCTPWSQHHVMSHSLLAPRHQIRYSFSVTLVETGHQARASVVDLWTRDVCSDCVSPFPAAQVWAGTLVARSTSLRQTSSTVMLHQVANSPIIRHDVFDGGPSTPYFSLPMVIMLGVFDDSVTDSIADALSS